METEMGKNEDLIIRKALPKDTETLKDFNIANAFETESITLDKEAALMGVQCVINDPSKGFYLVAEQGGEVQGCLMITTEWSDWRNKEFWWIESVYVRPESRKQGIYSLLYQYTEFLAKKANKVQSIRLYVDKHNQAAQAVYNSLGMRDSNYYLYEKVL